MNKSKKLQDLNLIDSFLFSASTENPKNAEIIAKLIIERATGRKVKEISVVQEKSLVGLDVYYHGIRMDLYVTEDESDSIVRVYDIEPNKYGIAELPRRSRFSQALTDAKLLNAGEAYEKLPEFISIWILTDDPFGKNQMLYIVKNCVEGFSDIVYNDGVKKLFLYVGGELGGSESLKDLLHYFSKSDKMNVVDAGIEQLHTIVENVKNNRKVGERYMTLQEMINYEKAEAREEALQEGREEGREAARQENILTSIKICKNIGASDEQIIQNIMEEYKLSEEDANTYLKKCN